MGGETHIKPSGVVYPKLVERPVGQQIRGIYKDRLRQFTDGGQYRGHNLRACMDEGRVSDPPNVKLQVWHAPDLSRPTFADAMSKAKWKETRKGESFGPSWSTHWIKVALQIPSHLEDKERLEFHWDSSNEALIWNEDGEPLQGLTGGGERVEWILPEAWRDGEEHIFYIEVACNGMFGNADSDIIQPPNPDRYFRLNTGQWKTQNVMLFGQADRKQPT
jgi:alpha-mannosidase